MIMRMRVRFAGCCLDSAARTLTRGGDAVALTPKAFALLEALVAAHPAAVAKDDLYERLWPDVTVEPGNLHNLVAEVRTAIGDEEHCVVRTVHRFGYALDAAIVREDAAPFRLVSGDRELPLAAGANEIGRDATGSPEVSRRHARIVVEHGRATIEDLRSKNGTFVRGQRITTPTPLTDGDEIILGRARFVFRAAGTAAETTMTAG